MSKALSSWLGLSLCTLGYLCATNNPVSAQVTSDGTVNTQVTENGNTAEITGGERAGDNLFHSFQDFSVETGNEAFFDNADSISNIFSRVTGGEISNIDGLISANGSANLFLINPAGIIFGENARLDVGGSFYGSTADSILFEDGEFSATDLTNPPVLTINAPIGLNLRDQPADIVNRSVVQDSAGEVVGLEVSPGNNLAFIGGNINFNGGNLTAKGGNIELGGLSETGIVSINPDGSLSFPGDVIKADVNLSNAADVDVTGTGGGSVTVNARNLNLTPGELGGSFIRAGIRPESTNPEAQAGDITIDVAENIALDNSVISNQVATGALGNSGNIKITTTSLEAINGGVVDGTTFGQGNAGLVTIDANNIFIDGVGTNASGTSLNSGVYSTVANTGVGNSGGIEITTSELSLTNGGVVNGTTFGRGNAGVLTIDANNIFLDGVASNGFSSLIGSTMEGQEGNAGDINITTSELSLNNGAAILASTLGKGNAGLVTIDANNISIDGVGTDASGNVYNSRVLSTVEASGQGDARGINITTDELSLTQGGRVDGSTRGKGNAGLVTIDADSIFLDGVGSNGLSSAIVSTVDTNGVGNAGDITITTGELFLTNGAQVGPSTFGKGNAGLVTIDANNISADGVGRNRFASGIFSTVGTDGVGNAEGINITTDKLSLTNGAVVNGSTFGKGNAGLVTIDADNISADGVGTDASGNSFVSGVYSNVTNTSVGDGGGIDITTGNLSLNDGASIISSTFGRGDAGLVKIDADNISADGVGTDANGNSFNSGVFSTVEATDASGNSGGIEIKTSELALNNGAQVDASTFGRGDAGLVKIDADNVSVDGASGVFSTVTETGLGDAGGIDITTGELSLTNGGVVSGSTFGRGNASLVTIDADNVSVDGAGSNESTTGVGSVVGETGIGDAGGIEIKTSELTLTNDAQVNASTVGQGNAGPVTIDADLVSLDGNSFIAAQAFGDANGGNLKIDANYIIAFPSNGRGNDLVAAAAQGRGGNIDLTVEQLFGLEIGEAINDKGVFNDNDNNDIDASSGDEGLGGTINIDTSDINPVQGATELPSNVVELEQNTAQACEASRGTANNGLAIAGKGGVTPTPDAPLNSENIISPEQNPAAYAIPEPIETSQGKIQPARGIKVTKSGNIILTAYRTNNAGERIPNLPNCNSY